MILEKEVDIEKLQTLETTEEMRNELLKLDGVGPKVADCILLFALKRLDVFPIDVWVRRVMNDLYIHNENEEKVNKKDLQKLAEEKFQGLSGIAQQYLFYWKREESQGA
jgi:N-glycosylase/DNA lyase